MKVKVARKAIIFNIIFGGEIGFGEVIEGGRGGSFVAFAFASAVLHFVFFPSPLNSLYYVGAKQGELDG
jgi:hypothetical protein